MSRPPRAAKSEALRALQEVDNDFECPPPLMERIAIRQGVVSQTIQSSSGRGILAKSNRLSSEQGLVAQTNKSSSGVGILARLNLLSSKHGLVSQPKISYSGRGLLVQHESSSSGAIQVPI